jgi:D-alanine transaminase
MNAFLNGKFLAAEDACLNIEDRGTLFGDGVYEVFKIHTGKVFQLDAHLKRLRYSAGELELEVPYSDEQITNVVEHLIKECNMHHGGVYLQLTRGAVERVHHFPDNCTPNFFMVAREKDPLPTELYKTGVDTLLLPDERWKRCDIKSLNLLANVLAKEKAKKKGAYDAIFYSEKGVTESTSSSVLAVFDGVLTVPPAGPWILPGITRQVAITLSKDIGIPVTERFYTCDELFTADEVMFTSSYIDVLPVTKIDRRTVGNGQPGPVAISLKEQFDHLLSSL